MGNYLVFPVSIDCICRSFWRSLKIFFYPFWFSKRSAFKQYRMWLARIYIHVISNVFSFLHCLYKELNGIIRLKPVKIKNNPRTPKCHRWFWLFPIIRDQKFMKKLIIIDANQLELVQNFAVGSFLIIIDS